jgi:hypothetical protein
MSDNVKGKHSFPSSNVLRFQLFQLFQLLKKFGGLGELPQLRRDMFLFKALPKNAPTRGQAAARKEKQTKKYHWRRRGQAIGHIEPNKPPLITS